MSLAGIQDSVAQEYKLICAVIFFHDVIYLQYIYGWFLPNIYVLLIFVIDQQKWQNFYFDQLRGVPKKSSYILSSQGKWHFKIFSLTKILPWASGEAANSHTSMIYNIVFLCHIIYDWLKFQVSIDFILEYASKCGPWSTFFQLYYSKL